MTDTTNTPGRRIPDRHGRAWFIPTDRNPIVQPVGHNEPPTELRLWVDMYGPLPEPAGDDEAVPA